MKLLEIYDFPKFKRPLVKAINKSGGQSEFARLLDTSPQHVYAWLYLLEKGVPAERCPQIEIITDGEITRKQLRPDIFGEDLKAPKLTIEEDLNRTIKRLRKLLKRVVYVDKDRLNIRATPKKGAK